MALGIEPVTKSRWPKMSASMMKTNIDSPVSSTADRSPKEASYPIRTSYSDIKRFYCLRWRPGW